MIRVAAVGDVHYDLDCRNRLRPFFEQLPGVADLLLIAGDLTQSGKVEEAQVLADDLRGLNFPVINVLGNHDYHCDQQEEIHRILREIGIHSLEGESVVVNVNGYSVGIAGVK